LGRPVTSPILRALALASLARGDLEAGSGLGAELSRAAERDADPVARVEGAYVSGVMAFWKGELVESERRLAEAIRWYRPERHRDHVLLYAQDPAVVCRSRLAWTLWHRGRVDEAIRRRDEALDLAERQGDPMGLAYALWFTLFVAIERGDVERMASQAEALKRIATTHRLLYADTVADGFLGYVDAARGGAREGIARMRATLADPRWLGMEYVLKLQTLFLVAKAAAGAGDLLTARATVAEALAYIGAAPSIWIPPLRQIDARAIGSEDRSGDRALPAFRAALEAARACGSAWIELGVAVDRGRWTLARGDRDRTGAPADLERALVPYADAPTLPAVAAGRIILERLTQEGGS
jgi:tetratricopeptide (TPR) repeat protein